MVGAPRASIYMGQGNHDHAEKILGNCFITQIIVSIVLTLILFFLEIVPSYLRLVQVVINLLCSRLYEYICDRNAFCPINTGDEYVYYGPGVCEEWDDFCCNWGIM